MSHTWHISHKDTNTRGRKCSTWNYCYVVSTSCTKLTSHFFSWFLFLSSCFQVCREYQRGNCSRGENDCRFAHPADSTMIDTNDNTVTVCMDYIKGRCSREKCKYFHPPAHLQAKIKAAQHQVNQATAAAAMVSSLYKRGHTHSHPHGRLDRKFFNIRAINPNTQ